MQLNQPNQIQNITPIVQKNSTTAQLDLKKPKETSYEQREVVTMIEKMISDVEFEDSHEYGDHISSFKPTPYANQTNKPIGYDRSQNLGSGIF